MPRSARHDKVEIYLHLLWTTWDRMPLILPEWEDELFALLHSRVQANRCALLARGAMPDHIHLLLSVRSTTRLCDLIKDLKGTSATLGMARGEFFKWRPTYAAFSVSRWDVPKIRDYILNQKEHHREQTLRPHLERFDEEYWYEDE